MRKRFSGQTRADLRATKARLADEYDAAQERGEVRTRADNQHVPDGNKPTVEDIGLTRKQVHEARQIRDA